MYNSNHLPTSTPPNLHCANNQNNFIHTNHVLTPKEQERKEKMELIDSFYSKTVPSSELDLAVAESSKNQIQESLYPLSVDDLKLLSSVTELFFDRLKPTNERRHAIIELFMKLPSSNWKQVQQLVSHYMGLDCCIDSLTIVLSLLVKFYSCTAREQLIDLAFKSVKFNTPPLERANLLSRSVERYIVSLKAIIPETPYDRNLKNWNFPAITRIEDPAKISEYVLSGKRFLLPEDFQIEREKPRFTSTLLDML